MSYEERLVSSIESRNVNKIKLFLYKLIKEVYVKLSCNVDKSEGWLLLQSKYLIENELDVS